MEECLPDEDVLVLKHYVDGHGLADGSSFCIETDRIVPLPYVLSSMCTHFMFESTNSVLSK
jgi:hypothetical protein